MTDNQNNSYNMGQTTVGFLDKNNSIFAANTKVTTLLTAIKNTLKGIDTAAQAQGINTKGATVNKKSLKSIAIEKSEHVCAGLMAYADDINDSILAASIHFTHTSFTIGSVSEITNRMQTVHDKAMAITIATLAPFNVIALDITDLQTAIDNFKTAAPLKKVLQAASKASTTSLNPLFTTLRSQLKKMDNLIKTFKVAQPLFVSGYTNARKIINLGKTQQAKEFHLMPHHFEDAFGMKFQEGDTFTIRNHSEVPIHAALSDNPAQMPTDIIVEIPPQQEYKLVVSSDFGGKFRHWLMIHNFADLDDAHVTAILARGKSQSQADSPGQTA